MQLYDIGMASMHTMDCFALAELGTAIGRRSDAAEMKARGTEMSALIEANLWDDATGIYANKKNAGSRSNASGDDFYFHVAPTSFCTKTRRTPHARLVLRLLC